MATDPGGAAAACSRGSSDGKSQTSVWRTVVEQSPFSTVVYDPEGHPIMANRAFRAFWGVGIDTAPPGYSVLDDPELERQGVIADVRRAFAGEVVTTPPIRYDISRVSTTGGGRAGWTQGHFYPIRDAAGRISHVVLTHIDLTDRIAAEEALRASERRFGAIVHQASVGIAQVDLTGRFTLVNDRYCELLGRSRDELLAMSMQDITHPEDLPANLRQFGRMLEVGEAFTIEKRYVRPDGSLIWVNNSVTAVRDEAGTPTSVLAVSIDVTARRRAEEMIRILAEAGKALSASLDYRTTLRSVAELVVPSFARWSMVFLGGRALEPVGTACAVPEKAEAVEEMARCIAAMPASEWNAARAVFETGEPYLVREMTEEFLDSMSANPEYRRLQRVLTPTSLISVPLVARGRTLGTLFCATDDATQRFDERDLAFAAELAQRAAAAVDNARLLMAERVALARTERLQAITALLASAVPTDEIGTLFVEEVREAFDADTAWLGLLTEDRSEFLALSHTGFPEEGIGPWLRFPADAPVPARDVVQDGEARWFASAAEMSDAYPATAETVRRIRQEAVAFLPLRTGEQVRGVMSLGFNAVRPFDEADRKFALALARQCAQALERARLYEAERAARAEAEAANEAKSDFLTKMSHELRTPLNAIGGYAELVELGVHGPTTPEQRAALERIQINQRHLLTLINDILDFSKVEAGTMRLSIEEVDAAGVLQAVEPLIGPQMRQKDVSFRAASPAPPLAALADRERVVQICLNLLANALKATPAGGAISLECLASGDQVAFRVRDTGVGIPADKLEAIFNPFTQLGRALSSPRDGVGLGLAISRELARAMGGDIRVESVPTHGSTFILTLPRAPSGTGERERSGARALETSA